MSMFLKLVHLLFSWFNLPGTVVAHSSKNVVVEEVTADMEALVLDKLAEAFRSDMPISSADLEVLLHFIAL